MEPPVASRRTIVCNAASTAIRDDVSMRLEGPVPRPSGQWRGWRERPELPIRCLMSKVSIVADNESA